MGMKITPFQLNSRLYIPTEYLTAWEARINKWSNIYKLVQIFKLKNRQMRTLQT